MFWCMLRQPDVFCPNSYDVPNGIESMNSKHASNEGYYPSTCPLGREETDLLIVTETIFLVYRTDTRTAEFKENLIELCSTERRRKIRLFSKQRRQLCQDNIKKPLWSTKR